MKCRFPRAFVPIALFVGLAPALGQEGSGSTEKDQALRFLQGLRDRGYFDLSLEYLETLRKAPDTPTDLKEILDYEEGKSLLDESSRMADLERRATQLDKARAKLDAFAKGHPNHELAPRALVQMARLLFERGQTAALQANEADTPAEKQTELAKSRAAFDQARKAYDAAHVPILADFNKFPKFIPEDDPDKPKFTRARAALMDAELQRALVDYEHAQTYEPKAKKRSELLTKSRIAFEDIYKQYRTQLAGLYARMWQAKCYEESGELGPAMGVYKELMDHTAVELRDLQRKVAYFQIIVDGKRGEYPLAVDQANRWLNQYPSARNTEEGLGVQLELAKSLLSQLGDLSDKDKEQAIRRATDILQPVVRVYSPVKPEALALLQKYHPRAALNATVIAGLNFENAYADAEGAIQTHEFNRAIALLRHAISRAERDKSLDNVNKARYLMAYACYAGARPYEAAVLGGHLARYYPKHGLAARGAEIAIASLAAAYGTYTQIDRAADLERLVDLCQYAAETFPETDQGDFAKTVLGEVAMGRGNYPAAAAAFEAVRVDSPRRLDSAAKAGDSHWRQGLILRDQGKTKEADAESAKALALLSGTLKTRKDAGIPPADPGMITNINALAEIHRASGRTKEALALLEPQAAILGAAQLPANTVPLYEALLTVMLKTHIADGQSDKAIADMKALEEAGSSKAKLTQLYYQLSKSLQKDMDAQKASHDPADYTKTSRAYQLFLATLAASEAGQSYDSLMFAGESMLNLGNAKEASDVFKRVLESKDPDFKQTIGSPERLLRTKLRMAEALRKQKKFTDAQTFLADVVKDSPRLLEPKLERGYLLEDWAKAEPNRWGSSYKYWRALASQLEPIRSLRINYYESLYHLAIALQGLGRGSEAKQTLRSVMTLSPTVGSPEMKKRYEDLLAGLGQ